MEQFYYKHYIRTDVYGNVIKGFSDAFEQPDDYDVLINEQGGYQFRLEPHGEENPQLLHNDNGVPLYKWNGEKIEPRTYAEIQVDIAALLLSVEV